MVFYGTSAKRIKDGQIINVDCPHCEKNSSMSYAVFGKYAHIYWIPFFPYGKVTVTECNECSKTFEVNELTPQIITKLEREKEKNPSKYPIWYFSGLFIIALIAIVGYFSSQMTSKNEATYLKSPKVGDIYHFSTENGYYSTMKVEKVLKDSLYVYVNEMETNKKSATSDIDKPENYKELYSLPLKEIREMYKLEEIYEIERN